MQNNYIRRKGKSKNELFSSTHSIFTFIKLCFFRKKIQKSTSRVNKLKSPFSIGQRRLEIGETYFGDSQIYLAVLFAMTGDVPSPQLSLPGVSGPHQSHMVVTQRSCYSFRSSVSLRLLCTTRFYLFISLKMCGWENSEIWKLGV